MVNMTNLSLYTGQPPDAAKGRTRIEGGPLYSKEDVLSRLQPGTSGVRVVTRKAISDAASLGFDDSDLTELLYEAMVSGQYRGSESCMVNERAWAGCDAYRIERPEWNEYLGKYMSAGYYVKFALGRTGLVVLLISCHLSG